MIKVLKTDLKIDKKIADNLKIAIVRSNYHKELIDNLEEYCINTLIKVGLKKQNIEIITAPGSWEIPLFAKVAAESKKYDGIVTFGVIVKGETYHFEMIANETARSLMQVSLDYNIPLAMEILAVNTIEQAEQRASKNEYNKGTEGAEAILKSILELKKHSGV